MPHAIFVFLDAWVVRRNRDHPGRIGRRAKDWRANFTDAGPGYLAAHVDVAGAHPVAFQEYAPAYPPSDYTVRLSGRPGGPDFYVDTPVDARRPVDTADADPCFAQVVAGTGVVDELAAYYAAAPRGPEDRATIESVVLSGVVF